MRKAIKGRERLDEMNFESKLRAVCNEHDTQFIEYRPQTGTWVFKVNHFSKYGLAEEKKKSHECKICEKNSIGGII